jgi:hypothetical protein
MAKATMCRVQIDFKRMVPNHAKGLASQNNIRKNYFRFRFNSSLNALSSA